MAQPESLRMTAQEYLARERAAETRSEFYNGEAYAMAGASSNHAELSAALVATIYPQLLDGPCRVASSDLRTVVASTGAYTYPDVVVMCEEPRFEDDQRDTLVNPVIVVEVLSPSTEAHDRGAKFAHYQLIPSLQHYVLVAQDQVRVEHFRRQSGNEWLYSRFDGADDVLRLDPPGIALRVGDLYRRIKFEVATKEEPSATP